jgi:hypothetical protein
VLAGACLLAGCGGAAPSNPTLAACQARADADPAVKAQVIKSVSNPYYMSQSSELIAATKARAVQDCMKRQGALPAGGGVEGTPTTDTIFQK